MILSVICLSFRLRMLILSVLVRLRKRVLRPCLILLGRKCFWLVRFWVLRLCMNRMMLRRRVR